MGNQQSYRGIDRDSKPQGEMLSDLAHATFTGENLTEVFQSWGVNKKNLQVREICGHLERAWASWPAPRRMHLVEAAAAVMRAERSKRRWVSVVQVERHQQLALAAIDGAQLALTLSKLFPRPWHGDEVERLVATLVAFLSAAVDETAVPEHEMAVGVARARLKALRRHTSGRPHWELVADLAWLASGLQHKVSERTVRRYLTASIRRSPAGKVWAPNFRLMGRAARLVPASEQNGRFVREVRKYVHRPR